MKHRAVVVNGIQRSGSNILWNVLQSHPALCAPPFETGEIFPCLRQPESRKCRAILGTSRIAHLGWPIVGVWVRRRLHALKMQTLGHPDNRFKSDGILYTRKEVEESRLCLKSLDDDLWATDFLRRLYPESSFVGLVRNGFALCEGLVRRGVSLRNAAEGYVKYTSKILEDSERLSSYMVVRFETLVDEPFEVAEKVFGFLGLSPRRLAALRLKMKRVVHADGAHATPAGIENRKYWFTTETIGDVLRRDVTENQEARLSAEQRDEVTEIAGPLLRRLGYLDERN